MLKNLIAFTAIILLIASCGNKNNQDAQAGNEDSAALQPVVLAVAAFDSLAPTLVDKPVQIKGMVSHTCRHGGKRLFLIDENPDISVEVTASDKVGKFEQEIEGSDILVSGVLRELRIDEPYLSNWEKELAEKGKSESKVHKNHDPEKDPEGDIEAEMKQIEGYRTQLKEAGVDHLSFFSVECEEFDVVETDTVPAAK